MVMFASLNDNISEFIHTFEENKKKKKAKIKEDAESILEEISVEKQLP